MNMGYPVVSSSLSTSTLHLLRAASLNVCRGWLVGQVDRTSFPGETSFLSIAGTSSATSCQLFGESCSSRKAPRPSVTAFFHFPLLLAVGGLAPTLASLPT